MGSHSLQAVALAVFFLAAVAFCSGLATGGNILLLLAGAAAFGVSLWLFVRCKQMEGSRS